MALAPTALASESECGDAFKALTLYVMAGVSTTADHLERVFPLEVDTGPKCLVAFDPMAPHIRMADLCFHGNRCRGGNARGYDHHRNSFHFLLHGGKSPVEKLQGGSSMQKQHLQDVPRRTARFIATSATGIGSSMISAWHGLNCRVVADGIGMVEAA